MTTPDEKRSHSVLDIIASIPEPEIKLEAVTDDDQTTLESVNRNNASLFNNPYFKEAEKKMDPVMRSTLKKQGQYVYGYDYINAGDDGMRDAAARSLTAIRSGLFIDNLSIDEIAVLDTCNGKYWCEEFDMKREELEEIIKKKSDERNADLDRQRQKQEGKEEKKADESDNEEEESLTAESGLNGTFADVGNVLSGSVVETTQFKSTASSLHAFQYTNNVPTENVVQFKTVPNTITGKSRKALRRKMKRSGCVPLAVDKTVNLSNQTLPNTVTQKSRKIK